MLNIQNDNLYKTSNENMKINKNVQSVDGCSETEKCGLIQITKNGIFEINCLLCDQQFSKIRNFANHIIQKHFQNLAESTVDYLMEYDQIDILNNQVFIDESEHTEDVNNEIQIEEIVPKCNSDILEVTTKNLFDENSIENETDQLNMSDNFSNSLKEEHKLDAGHLLKEKFEGFNKQEENSQNHFSELKENSSNGDKKENTKLNVSKNNNNPICKICGKETAKYKMRQHLRSHDNSRYVHQCKTCLKLFISEKSLNFHIKNLHTEEKPYICTHNNCGKRYVNENALNAHIKRHGDRPFSCHICEKGFLYKSRLNEHINNHITKLRKETGLVTPIESEDQIISNNKEIQNSEVSNFVKEIEYDPSKGKKFKQKQIIKPVKRPRKIRNSVKLIEKIICDICGKEIPKSNMKQHLRSHDNSRYTHECDKCERIFISVKSLDLHKKNVHDKDKPFSCNIEQCNKQFVDKNALKSHITRHNKSREFKCETCNKSFIYQYRLDEHIKTYHVNGRKFRCNMCEKRFFDKYTLERHQVVHSEDKPFPCDKCPAKFSRKRTLEWHKKSHSEAKDYTCKICGKQYALYNGIYSHMKIHGIKYSIAYEKGYLSQNTDGSEDNVEQETNVNS